MYLRVYVWVLYSWLPHSERSAWGHVKYDISELPYTGELMGNYFGAGELYDISLAKLDTFFFLSLSEPSDIRVKRYAAELPINTGRFFFYGEREEVESQRGSCGTSSTSPSRPAAVPSGVEGEGPDTY